MATYDIDGIKYDIADGVDLQSTVSAIRAHPSHKAGGDSNNFSDHLMRNVKGGITAAGDLIAGVPGMIAAAPYALYEGITEGPQKGLEAMGEISTAMNPLRE